MAHRPTNPSPYFECVDAGKDIDVRFLIANHDVVTSAKIKVMKNDLDAESNTFPVVTKIEWSGSVYGGNGDDSFVDIVIPKNTLSNGTEYKWAIELLNGEAVDNREFYFKAEATPVVSIDSPADDTISSVSASFSGSCNGEIEYYRWVMSDDSGSIIDETDNLYDVNLKYEYTGLFPGSDVTVTLYIKTKMRHDELSASRTYTVDYELYNSNINIGVESDAMNNRAVVDFKGMSFIQGISGVSDYELDGNGLVHVKSGSTIEWNSKDDKDLKIPNGVGYSTKFKLDDCLYGTIVEINDDSGEFRFGYDGAFYYTINGVETRIDMSTWFSNESMFQSSTSDANTDVIYHFNVSQTINFDDDNTFVKIRDAVFLYWWYLTYYNGNVRIVKGEAIS